jgi:site-specific recombinase XerD
MSRKNQAKHSIAVANAKLGGARITKMQRTSVCKHFVNWCYENRYVITSIAEVSGEMVLAYLQYLKAEGISIATQHNRLASIRRAMRALGKSPDEVGISAKALNLESRDRRGTKEPISNELLAEAVNKAIELNEHGFAIALRLQRLLGYRGLESLMSVQQLEKFAIEASVIVKTDVAVISGTKGGRPRFTQLIHSRAAETISVIQEALEHMRAHGFLVSGGKTGLKTARSKYHFLAAKVGLTGKYSPHSLRYAYAKEKIEELRDQGFNRKETLALVANFLGHGASRSRYISSVYGQTVAHTVPIEKRKSRIERALENLKRLIDDLDKDMGQI